MRTVCDRLRDMDTILYFQSTATTSARMKLVGIGKRARAHGWIVQRFDLHDPADMVRRIAFWHPVGCIVEWSSDDFRKTFPRRGLGVPTVFIDCDPALARRGFPAVTQHPSLTGELAARELLALGLSSYAYAGWPERTFWNTLRERSFRTAVARAGFRCPTFRLADRRYDIPTLRDALDRWLHRLPKPVGIYSVNDSMSAQVLEAARRAGYSVPDDVVLLGTDNEENICENASPTLASIALDFEKAGALAADLLADLIRRKKTLPRHQTFGPLEVIRRTSIRRSGQADGKVMAALDAIRRSALAGVTSADILRDFGCSRRSAEMRFRKIVGRSIREEIHRVQIDHAKRLIAEGKTALSQIHSFCGYASNPFFARLFKRETGQTMREFSRAQSPRTR